MKIAVTDFFGQVPLYDQIRPRKRPVIGRKLRFKEEAFGAERKLALTRLGTLNQIRVTDEQDARAFTRAGIPTTHGAGDTGTLHLTVGVPEPIQMQHEDVLRQSWSGGLKITRTVP